VTAPKANYALTVVPPKRFANSDEVVSAAAHLFQRDGYQSTTIDDIARHLGVAKPTVYQYVDGKGSLLEQIVAQVVERLGAEHRRAIDSSDEPEVQLRRLVAGYVATVAEMRTHYRIFIGEEKELPEATRERFAGEMRRIADEFLQTLERCVDAGIVRDDLDPEIASFLIMGALTSISRWYDPDGPLDVDGLARQAMGLIDGYVQPSRSTSAGSA
jgi:AcrR family transcriptional regulator